MILSQLGAGGYSSVFEVLDMKTKRKMAMKDVSDKDETFVKEVKLLSKVYHHNFNN